MFVSYGVMRPLLRECTTFPRFDFAPKLFHGCFQCRWKGETPTEALQRRVGHLVGVGDADKATDEIRMGLTQSIFSMKAFANALFLLERTKNERVAMELVRLVRESGLVQSWDDESVLAVMLRLQCATDDAAGAMQMFSYMVSRELLRLRSVSIFLSFCCKRRDRHMTFAVYEEALRQRMELRLTDYYAIGRLCVDVGEPVSTLHFMLREMQGHLDGVTTAVVEDVIRPWALGGGLKVADVVFPQSDASLPPGTCESCFRMLSGHQFTEAQKVKLLADVVGVAMGGVRKVSPRARMAFEAWQRFIASHGRSIDVLIDGANLGYYGLSSWYALAKRELLLKRGRRAGDILPEDISWSKRRFVDVPVNFQLIDLAVQEARRRGLRPLVLLHERHCEPNNITAIGEALTAQWRQEGVLYCTPSGLNDDLCWLYAALELTTPTDAVIPSEGKTRIVWVLTNDLMRDHHFKLLSPRHFSRWRDRHRIAFKCSRSDGRTLLHWQMPAPYAQCIQELAPLTWHIPILSHPCKEENGEAASCCSSGSPADSVADQLGPEARDENAGCYADDESTNLTLESSHRWLCIR